MAILNIDLNKIKQNTSNIKQKIAPIELVAVSKALAGDVRVAQAFIDGGVNVLLDSKLSNLLKFKHLNAKKMLSRVPANARSEEVEGIIDCYLASNKKDILKIEKLHKTQIASIILLIETGFKREGFLEKEVKDAVEKVVNSKKLRLLGIATCTACMNGTNPENQIREFCAIADKLKLPAGAVMSGGNSSVLPLALNKKLPKNINQLRIGESILLGHDTAKYEPLANNADDAFELKVELIEARKKGGETLGVIGVGLQDIGAGNLSPVDEAALSIKEKYSDYITISIKDERITKKRWLSFRPDYNALLALNTSKYIKKEYLS